MTLDGAALLATLFPIGILILAVEARSLRPIPLPEQKGFLRYLFNKSGLYTALSAAGAVGGLLATGYCVWSVCTGLKQDQFGVSIVLVSGSFTVVAVVFALVRLLSEPPR